MDWTALGVSFRLSFWTMVLLVFAGMPIAYWVAFSRWRFKFLVEAIVALPLVLLMRRANKDEPGDPTLVME